MLDEGRRLILLTLQKQLYDALQLRSQHPDDFHANIIYLSRVQLIEKSIYDLFHLEFAQAKTLTDTSAILSQIKQTKAFIYDDEFKNFYKLCFPYNSAIADANVTCTAPLNHHLLSIFIDADKENKWKFEISFKDGSSICTDSICDPEKLRRFKSAFALKMAGTASNMLVSRPALKS